MVVDIAVGAVLPFLIDVFNRKAKSTKVKYVISLVVCLVVGALLNVGDLAGGNISQVLESGTLVFAAAQTVYKTYYKDSAVRKKIVK